MIPLFIPSPAQAVWHLGPVPIRAYALCVLAGIILAWFIVRYRWRRLGGNVEKLENLLLVTAVSGIVGARLYYILIEWPRYFGPDGVWYQAFFIWQGGLGIWGGVVGGGLAAFLMARHYRFNFPALADCFAVALPLAQAIGRFGNYFNQELYGRPTDLPWGLLIDPAHRVAGYYNDATFHPTFLYEALWNIALAAFLLFVVERRLHWGRGKLCATYVVGYAVGRFLVESFRIDPVAVFGGLRVNAWVTLVLGLAGLAVLLWLLKYRPGPNLPGSAASPADSPQTDQPEVVDQSVTNAEAGDAAGQPDGVAGPTVGATAVVAGGDETVGDPPAETDTSGSAVDRDSRD